MQPGTSLLMVCARLRKVKAMEMNKIETEPGLPFSDVELGYGMLGLVIKEQGRPLSRVHVAKL